MFPWARSPLLRSNPTIPPLLFATALKLCLSHEQKPTVLRRSLNRPNSTKRISHSLQLVFSFRAASPTQINFFDIAPLTLLAPFNDSYNDSFRSAKINQDYFVGPLNATDQRELPSLCRTIISSRSVRKPRLSNPATAISDFSRRAEISFKLFPSRYRMRIASRCLSGSWSKHAANTTAASSRINR